MNESILRNILIGILILFTPSCNDEEVMPTGKSRSYTINPINNSSINATGTIIELSNGYTRVELSLSGTSSDLNYLAHIHNGDIDNFGNIEAQLGNSNEQNTLISQDLTNRIYSYDDWLTFDGYIAIHIDDDDKYPIVAVGNIGANAE